MMKFDALHIKVIPEGVEIQGGGAKYPENLGFYEVLVERVPHDFFI